MEESCIVAKQDKLLTGAHTSILELWLGPSGSVLPNLLLTNVPGSQQLMLQGLGCWHSLEKPGCSSWLRLLPHSAVLVIDI